MTGNGISQNRMNHMQSIKKRRMDWAVNHPLLRKYLPLVHEDLGAIY